VSVTMTAPTTLNRTEKFDDEDLVCDRYPYRNIAVRDSSSVWGLDPGQRDLYHAVNEDGKHLRCSNKEFYHDAKYSQTTRKRDGWYRRAPHIRQQMTSLPTKRTATLAGLANYVRAVTPVMACLLDFHNQRPFRDLRFKRYVFSKRKFNKICESFIKASNGSCTIGVGDCGATSRASVIRGGPRAPVKRLARELSAHPHIVAPYVDEANSSRLCSCCSDSLVGMRKKVYDIHGCSKSNVPVYQVFHCRNSVCENTTVHRDVDAANSILQIFFNLIRFGERPSAYAYRRLMI